MGNIDAPFGLRPVGHIGGANWNGITERCYTHASEATAMYVGDVVALQTELDYMDPLAKHPSICRATAADGNVCFGVITGFEPNADTQLNYRAASTQRYAFVCTDPTVVYDVRDSGLGTPSKVWAGQNAILLDSTGGSTVTGLSGMELDAASDAPEANASNMLRILYLAPYEDNVLADFAIWRVLLNMHQYTAASGATEGMLGVTAT